MHIVLIFSIVINILLVSIIVLANRNKMWVKKAIPNVLLSFLLVTFIDSVFDFFPGLSSKVTNMETPSLTILPVGGKILRWPHDLQPPGVPSSGRWDLWFSGNWLPWLGHSPWLWVEITLGGPLQTLSLCLHEFCSCRNWVLPTAHEFGRDPEPQIRPSPGWLWLQPCETYVENPVNHRPWFLTMDSVREYICVT